MMSFLYKDGTCVAMFRTICLFLASPVQGEVARLAEPEGLSFQHADAISSYGPLVRNQKPSPLGVEAARLAPPGGLSIG